MRILPANGDGTLLPKTAEHKQIPRKSFRASKQPKAVPPRRPIPPHIVPLGEVAEGILQTLCQRHEVMPESVLRAVAENFLSDACEDPTLAPVLAEDARKIEQTGHLPDSRWQETTLPKLSAKRQRRPVPPPPALPTPPEGADQTSERFTLTLAFPAPAAPAPPRGRRLAMLQTLPPPTARRRHGARLRRAA